MASKTAYEELEDRIRELERVNNDKAAENEVLRENLNKFESESNETLPKPDKIQVSGINIEAFNRKRNRKFAGV